jgi:hypothetical protein
VTTNSRTPEKRSNLTLWLVLAVCVAPFVAAAVVSRYFPPESRMNYGELIDPVPLPEVGLVTLEGKEFQTSSLRGKWVMIHVDGGACPAKCVEKLWKIRQLRLTQGKNMDRIERLWLIDDQAPVDATLQKEYTGTVMLRAPSGLLRRLPSKDEPNTHIWLADPLGNVMLRYAPDADPSKMKNDLLRLLKVSQIG